MGCQALLSLRRFVFQAQLRLRRFVFRVSLKRGKRKIAGAAIRNISHFIFGAAETTLWIVPRNINLENGVRGTADMKATPVLIQLVLC